LRQRLLSGDAGDASTSLLHPATRTHTHTHTHTHASGYTHPAAAAAAASFASAAAATAGFSSIADDRSAGYHPGWSGAASAASAAPPQPWQKSVGLRNAVAAGLSLAGLRRNGSGASLSSLASWPEASAPPSRTPSRDGSPLPAGTGTTCGGSISDYEIGCVEGLLSLAQGPLVISQPFA